MQSNQKRISTQVVRQIAEADCCRCPHETDASQYHVACTLNLDAKDMLNPGTSLCASPIPSPFPISELLVARTFTLNMLPITHLLQPVDLLLRAIGRISPDIAAGILRIKQFFKHVAIVHFRTAHRVTTDQFVLHISRDMVLVAKEIFAILLGPAGIGIFLAALVIAPVFWLAPSLDLQILLTAVALDGHADNIGINYLSFLRPETFFQKKGIKLGEQRFHNSGIGEIVAESPDGRTVGNLAGGMQTKKPRNE